MDSPFGWHVVAPKTTPNTAIANLRGSKDKLEGAVVSVVGLYNRGKTHTLNRICGVQLPKGRFVHTRGISMKVPKTTLGNNLILLDTAGTHRPVKSKK